MPVKTFTTIRLDGPVTITTSRERPVAGADASTVVRFTLDDPNVDVNDDQIAFKTPLAIAARMAAALQSAVDSIAADYDSFGTDGYRVYSAKSADAIVPNFKAALTEAMRRAAEGNAAFIYPARSQSITPSDALECVWMSSAK